MSAATERNEQPMRKLIKKLHNQSGFTLAEALMAVIIVLLVSSVIAAGMPVAGRAYAKAVDAANAQALLSTTVNALRGELSTAWGVELDGDTIIYYSPKTGAKTSLTPGTNSIMLQDYIAYGGTEGRTDPVELISNRARDRKFSISYSNPTIEGNTISFENITVGKQNEEGSVLAESGTIAIRFLKKDFKIPEIMPDGGGDGP